VTLALFAGAALMVAAPAAAQIQVGTRVGEPAPVSAGTYESLGRRDPFVTLVAPRRTATAAGAPTMARPGQGLASLSIHDVVVTGIVRKDNMMMAIVQGSSQQSYVAKVNDRLADGVVKSIDARGVVFVEHSAPGSGTRGQETRKALRAAAEVNR
jgi:Tfp pilus assembly protein PilP